MQIVYRKTRYLAVTTTLTNIIIPEYLQHILYLHYSSYLLVYHLLLLNNSLQCELRNISNAMRTQIANVLGHGFLYIYTLLSNTTTMIIFVSLI